MEIERRKALEKASKEWVFVKKIVITGDYEEDGEIKYIQPWR